jgi:hypothetical protein
MDLMRGQCALVLSLHGEYLEQLRPFPPRFYQPARVRESNRRLANSLRSFDHIIVDTNSGPLRRLASDERMSCFIAFGRVEVPNWDKKRVTVE